MSVTTRQNRLLLAQDWKKIYQSFRNADFTSYDFENLRRTMIEYLRTNYPEDFNDYVESSEYLALIDLIAYLGQGIAFRIDLNARDNFLELSERREAILRLARMISYNAKRNTAANGLLKFNSVTTDENVIDANGRNLSGQTINWNDSSNANWYDQFVKVLNAAFPTAQKFGSPAASGTIYGIPTQQYRFNSSLNGIPVFNFNKVVAGKNMDFEITSTTFSQENFIYEEPPKLGNTVACVYRDDGRGPGSSGNGFFMNFTQGTLNQGTFTISQPTSNQSIDVDSTNINNNDVWLYRLDNNGAESEYWTQIPSLTGNNVIYNSLSKNVKNIYAVITRASDAISVQFSDGTFGNLPLGSFRLYYRVSNGLSYTINTQDIRNVSITIPYTSATGQAQNLTVTLNLAASVSNASTAETDASVKTNAPQTYYTQNRMITAEDYNISPLSASTQIAKVKSINRTTSGISRYFDLIDPTGKYGSTTLFGDDGVLYKEEYQDKFLFSYITQTDIQHTIYNDIYNILVDHNIKNFYYSKFINTINTGLNLVWNQVTNDTISSSGYIADSTLKIPLATGSFTATDLKYLQVGSLVKFLAPTGYYFDTTNYNSLVQGTGYLVNGAVKYLWVEVAVVSGNGTANGTGVLPSGLGPITLNLEIPSGAVLNQIIPPWVTTISSSVVNTMIELIFANKPFGLGYNSLSQTWQIIFENNLNTTSGFNLAKQGDTTNQNQDSSWILWFSTDNITYTVVSRQLRYIFESAGQISFYFDSSKKIYDTVNHLIVKDRISVLSVNKKPNDIVPFSIDYGWDIVKEWTGLDGYVDSSKLIVAFSESENNGMLVNPQQFLDLVTPYVSTTGNGIIFTNTITVASADGIVQGMQIVGQGIAVGAIVTQIVGNVITLNLNNTANLTNQLLTFNLVTYVLQQKYQITQGQEDYKYVKNTGQVIALASQTFVGQLNSYSDGQYFYFADTDVVKKLNLSASALIPTLDYKVYVGRSDFKFQYVHNADYESRIDPGASNIIDIYVLTKNYDTQFRQYVAGSISTSPLPPGGDEIFDLLSPTLNQIKSLSDEIIYHPVQYKTLFGQSSAPELQASFKVIKNASQVLSDNDIKSRIISAINQYFVLDNWDFGDTFYFSELSTYVMGQLAPDVASFVIVPRQGGLGFGSLFEITSATNELFISTATVDDIEIITDITSSNIKSVAGTTVSTASLANQNITSSTYGSTNG